MSKKHKRIYIDQAGNHLSGKSQIDRHHLVYDKSLYYSRSLRKHEHRKLYEAYRVFPGFVAMMRRDYHEELHKNIEPPIKPHEELMVLILNNIETQGVSNHVMLENTINYLGGLASLQVRGEATQRQVDDGSLLLDNLTRQQTFVELGRVVLLQLDQAS